MSPFTPLRFQASWRHSTCPPPKKRKESQLNANMHNCWFGTLPYIIYKEQLSFSPSMMTPANPYPVLEMFAIKGCTTLTPMTEVSPCMSIMTAHGEGRKGQKNKTWHWSLDPRKAVLKKKTRAMTTRRTRTRTRTTTTTTTTTKIKVTHYKLPQFVPIPLKSTSRPVHPISQLHPLNAENLSVAPSPCRTLWLPQSFEDDWRCTATPYT